MGSPKVRDPFAHVATSPLLSNELGDVVTPLAGASRALNPQRVQLASDITEGEIGPGHSRKLMLSSIRLLELRAHTAPQHF